MAVNKVVINNETQLDLTADTVDAAHLAKGFTAHNMKGESIVGTMEAGGRKKYTFTDGLTETDGTVKWDLSDRIKAGTAKGSVRINGNDKDDSVYNKGECSLALGMSGSQGKYAGSKLGIGAMGNGSLAFGDLGTSQNYSYIQAAG